jgi:DNA-binding MarR family transcriptional regulator
MSEKSEVEFHFKVPEESSGFLLWQVTMLWQRQIKKGLDVLGITHTQFVLLAALAWLSKLKNAVNQVDIANHSNTDRMMVSKVLRTLEQKKYIQRTESLVDTRAKNIVITESGRVVIQKALIIVEKIDLEFFEKLKTQKQAFNINLNTLLK